MGRKTAWRMGMNFEYRIGISVEDYNYLREAVGWEKLNKEQAQAGIENSNRIISCYTEEKIAGSARVLWDHGYIAYLSDVMVLPEYQGLGIGKELIALLIDHLKGQLKDDWKVKIVLVSAKGKEPFYEKFGFTRRPDENGGAGMQKWITK